MSRRSAAPLVASRARLWERRAIGLFGLGAVALGIVILARDLLSPSPDLPRGNTVAFLFVFLAGFVYLLVGTMRFNLMGVWPEGIAPPMKPLRALLKEPFILRWKEITSIELHPNRDPGKPPRRFSVVLTTTSGDRVRIESDVVGSRFGAESQTRQFYSLVALSAGNLGEADFMIQSQDPQVRHLLSTRWRETGAYRRTKASWTGILIGGPVALMAFWFAGGPRDQYQFFRGIFIISGFVFLWSLLSPGLFRRRSVSEGSNSPE